jgi:hypothetical protein
MWPTAIDLDPTSLRAHRAVDLDRASCIAHHRRPLPQALDMTSNESDTPPLPHVTVCANVSEFDWIKLTSLLILVDFMEFSDSLVNFSGF